MKRIQSLLVAALLVPVAASADDLSATLSGQAGQGVASLVTSNTAVTYTILANGIGRPTRAVILRDGDVFLNLDATFTEGSAVGQKSAARGTIDAIEADPGDFTLRVESGSGSISGNLAGVTGGGSNPPTGDALQLLGGRLRVQVAWENQFNSTNGNGLPIPSTDLAGFFAFDDPNNIELAVKALDFGDRILFFYGQLTNLFFTITVTDTQTGAIKTYSNGPNNCGAVDEEAFPQAGILGVKAAPQAIDAVAGEGIPLNARVFADKKTIRRSLASSSPDACTPNANTLCLLGGRMQLSLTWRNQFDNTSGAGIKAELSELTGAFAFDNPSNLELIVKTLDFGDRVLVLWGALSNFEYTLTVTDTVSGETKSYTNPAGTYCGGLDNDF